MEGGAKDIDSSKIEIPNAPIPAVEGVKVVWEFNREKFVKDASMDVYNKDGVKCNMGLKWTWSPAKATQMLLYTKKLTLSDLGDFVAHAQSEVETELKALDKVDHKHSVNLKGDDWQFGMAYDHLQKSKKVGVKASY